MTACDVITALDSAGITAAAAGDRIVLRPSNRVTPDLVALAANHKSELLALLCPAGGVGWRAGAMRTRIPERGPIALLVAVPGLPPTPGRCFSCYALIGPDRTCARCTPCCQAAGVALGWRCPTDKEGTS